MTSKTGRTKKKTQKKVGSKTKTPFPDKVEIPPPPQPPRVWEVDAKERVRIMRFNHGYMVDVIEGGTCFIPFEKDDKGDFIKWEWFSGR